MSGLELLSDAREHLHKRTLISSGLGLLMAAASRLPTWEVSAPVQWLVGTVNVGFLPIFGPIIIFGAYCFTLLAVEEVETIAKVIRDTPAASDIERALTDSHRSRTPRDRIATVVFGLWIFVVPMLAYAILLDTYFDFVRPGKTRAESHYIDRTDQILDLLIGIGGWGSFKPVTPSITDNLKRRAGRADKKDEANRILGVAEMIPWIQVPLQTWGYIGGLGLMIFMSRRQWTVRIKRRVEHDAPPPAEPETLSLGSE
jgi:hypothetical protein